MPGCARISGSLHMNIQTSVLIGSLQALISDLCWCSCNIFSTQDHILDSIMGDKSAAVFPWKGEFLWKYWDCIMNALMWPEDDSKGHIPDMIVYDGVA